MEIPSASCHISGMTKKPKRPRDVSQLAKHVIGIATGEVPDNDILDHPPAVQFGKQGGTARAQNLTKEERREIAIQAARARWKK